MVGTVVVSVTYFFLILFQCRPSRCPLVQCFDPIAYLPITVNSIWNDSPVGPRCLKHSVHMGITYFVGVTGAASDWVFGTLPFFIVWGMDMDVKAKMLVAGILAFAAM